MFLLQNVILGFSFASALGPVSFNVINKGLKHGFTPAFLVALGAISADVMLLVLGLLGLTNLIQIPFVKTLVWSVGALVLFYIAYSSIRDSSKIHIHKSRKEDHGSAFFSGFAICASSPISIVWWLSIAGSSLSSAGALSFAALLPGISMILGILIWYLLFCLLLHWGKRFVNESSMRYVSLLAALVFFAFGLYFGYNVLTA